MYVMRGSWVGRTFALATPNDSGGRKARIRRSKEERKAMVESFIKRYQNSNEGNFPSLNLTHKEVGGSFYTVREIVREIIQENKVLGPARYTSEVKKDDHITEYYPLGSISTEPQDFLYQSENEINATYNHDEEEIVKQTLNVNLLHTNSQNLPSVQCSSDHQIEKSKEENDEILGIRDNNLISIHHNQGNLGPSLNSNGNSSYDYETDSGNYMNAQTIGLPDASDELLAKKPVLENSEDEKLGPVGAFNAALTLPTEELEVETFPPTPARKETDDRGTKAINSGNIDRSLNNLETKQSISSSGSAILDEVTDFTTDDQSDVVARAKGSDIPNLDGDSRVVKEHEVVSSMSNHNREVNLRSNSLEMSDLSTSKKDVPLLIHGHVNQVASHGDLMVETAERNKELDGFQPMNAHERSHGENGSKTTNINVSKELKTVAANGYNTISDQSKKGSSPTLDRINLESWPQTSKKGSNPLLAIYKALKDAFDKFWSS